MSNTRIHCEIGLVKVLPRWRRATSGEIRPRGWPELRRRWRRGSGGGKEDQGVRVGNCPEGSLTHPFYTWPTLRPDYPARGANNPAPPDIFRPGKPELTTLKFSKIDVVLTKNLNSCAKIRCLEIGWLR
jgi:hypothetical protein